MSEPGSNTRIIARRDDVVLRVGVFGGLSAFPVTFAATHGHMARHALVVDLILTPSSDALRTGLRAGTLDIVHAAADNVLAWAEAGDDVVAWLGGSNGPISLVARTARSVPALRGATIGVDSPGSGFATILRRMLVAEGMTEADIRIQPIGATRHRASALADGQIDATMLTQPWTALAERDGAAVLQDHRAVAADIVTSVAISGRAWLRSHVEAARGYAAAISEGLAELANPAVRDTAVGDLAAELAIDVPLAGDLLATMLGPDGWPPGGQLTGRAMDAVATLRAEATGRPMRDVRDLVEILSPRAGAASPEPRS